MSNGIRGPEWFARQDWVELRKKGREHFIWFHRVLLLGVPIGASLVVWAFDLLGLHARDALSRQGFALMYFCIGVTVVVAYVFAWLEWVDREEKFSRRDKQD